MRVPILHHASEPQVVGSELIEELRRHGYSISAGTLHPMVHGLEEAGALHSSQTLVAGKIRKYYQTTRSGDALFGKLRSKVREFADEVVEESSRFKGATSKQAPELEPEEVAVNGRLRPILTMASDVG